ncbi:MAG: methyltransferase domain-containing protein [Phycisphaerales bacterium]|nr:methyltransferase domain-containing protein [Phycisphaerales bacterium]
MPQRPKSNSTKPHGPDPKRSEGGSSKPAVRAQFIARGVRVVYEDEHVIVVDKPIGMITADPARATGSQYNPSAREGETLFDAVKKHVKAGKSKVRAKKSEEGDRPRIGRVWVIHRLDKEASGLVVFGKTDLAFEKLKDQFHAKLARRMYFAVTEGILAPEGATGTHQSMIAEDRGPGQGRIERPGMRPGGDGRKLAITHYRVVATSTPPTPPRSLVQVRLETGRKNQIRVHMQELGHPLAGDRRFGATSDPIERVALHAAELGFEHPETGEAMMFRSPVPGGFYRAVGQKPPRDAAADQPDFGDEDHGSASRPPGTVSSAKPPTRAANASAGATPREEDTSWNEVAQWYDNLLEDKGSDHYEQIIVPGTIALLGGSDAIRSANILDVACGQGMLCRRLATLGATVTGVDAAPKLIEAARTRATVRSGATPITYHIADARDFSALKLKGFDAATCIMALSNIDPIEPALAGISGALRPGGTMVAVIVHPAFRSPGETHWGWDDQQQRQFRRVDAYLTPYRKDIRMHPGKAAQGKREGTITTQTFHRPIGAYVKAITASGLRVTHLGEWISRRAADSGPRAPEENRARMEIPLFLAIVAEK